jgi:hypothetical protein
MTTFESTAIVNSPVNDVYLFLDDMNNHRQLMPDSVTDWESTLNNASFNVQGMLKLFLKIDSRKENQEIKIIPAEKPPFDLELNWALSAVNEQTSVVFTITADLSVMMKLMASGPLQKLADYEVQALTQLLS